MKTLSWDDAEEYCVNWGGHLASVQNEAEMKVIHKIIKAKKIRGLVWIGASDKKQEKTWTWSDGSKWQYSNWDRNEPNNSGGN